METPITTDNIAEVYASFLAEYEFDMEAYAEVAHSIVEQNEDISEIGRLMVLLQNIFNDQR